MPPTMTLRASGVTSPPARELPIPKIQPANLAVLGRAWSVAVGVPEETGVDVIKSCVPLVKGSGKSFSKSQIGERCGVPVVLTRLKDEKCHDV